jgi:hypothetical protein
MLEGITVELLPEIWPEYVSGLMLFSEKFGKEDDPLLVVLSVAIMNSLSECRPDSLIGVL